MVDKRKFDNYLLGTWLYAKAPQLNSATRLQNLLRQAEHFQDNIQVLEAWAKILGVNESNPNKRATQVSERLGWLHRELGVVSVWMQSTNFSESLYSGALTNIECSLSPMLLGASWSQVKQHLRQETLVALAFCTEILPDEETEISSEALSETWWHLEARQQSRWRCTQSR